MARPVHHDPLEWYSASRASRLSGLSLAMVNYLCRERIVVPSCSCPRGYGVPRHYSFGDVVALRLVAKLSAAGVSSLRLKRGMQRLQKHQANITISSLPASHLVTDGRDIYLRRANDSLERAIDGQFAFAFVIELEQVRREVVEKMSAVELLAANG